MTDAELQAEQLDVLPQRLETIHVGGISQRSDIDQNNFNLQSNRGCFFGDCDQVNVQSNSARVFQNADQDIRFFRFGGWR